MRHKDDKKAFLIREKAIEMIVTQGFDGFSMQKLAKAVSISPSTLYIYFENKEDMLAKLFNEVVIDFNEKAIKYFEESMTLEEVIWNQWMVRLNSYLDDYKRFYFWEQFKNSPLIEKKNIVKTEYNTRISAYVKNKMDKKEMIEVNFSSFWCLAFGPFYSMIKIYLNKGENTPEKVAELKEELKKIFTRVMLSLQS